MSHRISRLPYREQCPLTVHQALNNLQRKYDFNNNTEKRPSLHPEFNDRFASEKIFIADVARFVRERERERERERRKMGSLINNPTILYDIYHVCGCATVHFTTRAGLLSARHQVLLRYSQYSYTIHLDAPSVYQSTRNMSIFRRRPVRLPDVTFAAWRISRRWASST